MGHSVFTWPKETAYIKRIDTKYVGRSDLDLYGH